MRALAERSEREVSDTLSLTERQIREHGITYNVYADAQGVHRPWEVDPIPLVLPADEWATIAAGIEQRADLLNRVLGDLYGAQTLMKSGAIPPVGGLRPPRLPRARARASPGRRPAPAAVRRRSRALARRPLVGRRRPHAGAVGVGLRAREPARRLARLPADVPRAAGAASRRLLRRAARSSLLHWAPRGDGPARIVLLTPGPYNETYFEHALLARYLGFALVEGQRPDRARRPRLAEDDVGPAARPRDRAPPGRRLLRPARAALRFRARHRRPDRLRAARQRAARQRARLGRPRIGRAARLPAAAQPRAARRAAAAAVDRDLVARRAGRVRGRVAPSGALDHQADRALADRAGGRRRAPLGRGARSAAGSHLAPAAALRRPGVGPRLAGAGARGSDGRRARRAGSATSAPLRRAGGAHRRPARLRGRDAERLARHAGRPDASRRRRGLAGDRDAARRPLEGHLGARRGPGQRRVLAPVGDRDRRRPRPRRRDPRLARRREPVLVRPLRRALRRHRAPASRRHRPGSRRQRQPRRQAAGVGAGRASRHRRAAARARHARCAAPPPIPRARSRSAWPACRASPSACASGCRSTTGERSTA